MNPEAKTVDDSRVETVHIVRPTHLNGAGRLFGGILMQWIDEVAGIVAKRHCGGNVTTASVDNLTFLHGAYQNDMVVIKGKLNGDVSKTRFQVHNGETTSGACTSALSLVVPYTELRSVIL